MASFVILTYDSSSDDMVMKETLIVIKKLLLIWPVGIDAEKMLVFFSRISNDVNHTHYTVPLIFQHPFLIGF